ncbi:MAG: hypothetical protein AVDCRST_MAG15-327, partial [uncultured Rubellimicrobium sp.]
EVRCLGVWYLRDLHRCGWNARRGHADSDELLPRLEHGWQPHGPLHRDGAL